MNLYLVSSIDPEDGEIAGIFDSREKADEVCSRLNADVPCRHCGGTGVTGHARNWERVGRLFSVVQKAYPCPYCNHGVVGSAHSLEVTEHLLNKEQFE